MNQDHHQDILAGSLRDWAPASIGEGQKSLICSGVLRDRDELPEKNMRDDMDLFYSLEDLGLISDNSRATEMEPLSLSLLWQQLGIIWHVLSKPFLRKCQWPERLLLRRHCDMVEKSYGEQSQGQHLTSKIYYLTFNPFWVSLFLSSMWGFLSPTEGWCKDWKKWYV